MDNTLVNPIPLSDEKIAELRVVIAKGNWRRAKSAQYQGELAHSYHVYKDDPAVCTALVKAIREHGYTGYFAGKPHKYLWIDDHKYWEYDGDLVNREHRKVTEARIAADQAKAEARALKEKERIEAEARKPKQTPLF